MVATTEAVDAVEITAEPTQGSPGLCYVRVTNKGILFFAGWIWGGSVDSAAATVLTGLESLVKEGLEKAITAAEAGRIDE